MTGIVGVGHGSNDDLPGTGDFVGGRRPGGPQIPAIERGDMRGP